MDLDALQDMAEETLTILPLFGSLMSQRSLEMSPSNPPPTNEQYIVGVIKPRSSIVI